MWETSCEAFAARWHLSLEEAALFASTAEHLTAKMGGGKDSRSNIVAACKHCNSERHAPDPSAALDPDTYQAHVALMVADGLWHACRRKSADDRSTPRGGPIPM